MRGKLGLKDEEMVAREEIATADKAGEGNFFRSTKGTGGSTDPFVRGCG